MHGRFLAAVFALISLGVTSIYAQQAGIREVSASDRTVIPLNTKIRYTTMIVLPDGEEILDVVCGDRDFWVISATHNIAHVKPAKDGAATNLNLVTANGSVYSFLLNEGKAKQPDLKVYVLADPNAPPSTQKSTTARRNESVRPVSTSPPLGIPRRVVPSVMAGPRASHGWASISTSAAW